MQVSLTEINNRSESINSYNLLVYFVALKRRRSALRSIEPSAPLTIRQRRPRSAPWSVMSSMRRSMRRSAPLSIRLSVKIINNNNNNSQLMEESEGMELVFTVGRLDPQHYRQHQHMSVHRLASHLPPPPHHHHHHQGFHIHQQLQFSVQPQRLTVSLLVEIPHRQDPPQLALNTDHLLSLTRNLAMVEMEDHHQNLPQLALNMDHLLSLTRNLAMMETEDHHQNLPQLALNTDHLLSLILNLAMVEMEDHLYKMIMDLQQPLYNHSQIME